MLSYYYLKIMILTFISIIKSQLATQWFIFNESLKYWCPGHCEPRDCSHFQGKSVHSAAIFTEPLGSYFRRPKPTPTYLNGESLKSQKSEKLLATLKSSIKSDINCLIIVVFLSSNSVKKKAFKQNLPVQMFNDFTNWFLYLEDWAYSTIVCIALSPIHK